VVNLLDAPRRPEVPNTGTRSEPLRSAARVWSHPRSDSAAPADTCAVLAADVGTLRGAPPRPGPPPEPVSRRLRRARLPDLPLALATAALFVVGCLAVYAATRNGLAARGRDPAHFLKRNLLNGGLGLVFAVAAARVDLRRVSAFLPLLYGGLLLALLAVLTPAGVTINGAHAWFRLGPAELEPSEFLKVLLVVGGAQLLSAQRESSGGLLQAPGTRDVLRCVALTGAPLLLVLIEPALGVVLVVLVVLVALIALAGTPRWLLLALLLAGGVAVLGATATHLVKPYQEARFTAFTHPDQATDAGGYHLSQSLDAIGGGGLTGRGFLDGPQTNGGFIPEQQTDFIFSVIGEEAGLAGTGVLLTLYGVLLTRGLRIAARAADTHDMLIATGVTSWFAFQAFINIGMTMGLAPVTGLPLPLVSYGGTALFATLIAIGLLQNVARRAR